MATKLAPDGGAQVSPDADLLAGAAVLVKMMAGDDKPPEQLGEMLGEARVHFRRARVRVRGDRITRWRGIVGNQHCRPLRRSRGAGRPGCSARRRRASTSRDDGDPEPPPPDVLDGVDRPRRASRDRRSA